MPSSLFTNKWPSIGSSPGSASPGRGSTEKAGGAFRPLESRTFLTTTRTFITTSRTFLKTSRILGDFQSVAEITSHQYLALRRCVPRGHLLRNSRFPGRSCKTLSPTLTRFKPKLRWIARCHLIFGRRMGVGPYLRGLKWAPSMSLGSCCRQAYLRTSTW